MSEYLWTARKGSKPSTSTIATGEFALSHLKPEVISRSPGHRLSVRRLVEPAALVHSHDAWETTIISLPFSAPLRHPSSLWSIGRVTTLWLRASANLLHYRQKAVNASLREYTHLTPSAISDKGPSVLPWLRWVFIQSISEARNAETRSSCLQRCPPWGTAQLHISSIFHLNVFRVALRSVQIEGTDVLAALLQGHVRDPFCFSIVRTRVRKNLPANPVVSSVSASGTTGWGPSPGEPAVNLGNSFGSSGGGVTPR